MENILLYGFIFALQIVFQIAARVQPQFRNAVIDFQAVYHFYTNSAEVYLIFNDGKIHMKKKYTSPPDLEIKFLDIVGCFKIIAEDPSNVMRLLLENKIEKKGNLFYLYKFGFLIALCEKEVKGYIS